MIFENTDKGFADSLKVYMCIKLYLGVYLGGGVVAGGWGTPPQK